MMGEKNAHSLDGGKAECILGMSNARAISPGHDGGLLETYHDNQPRAAELIGSAAGEDPDKYYDNSVREMISSSINGILEDQGTAMKRSMLDTDNRKRVK